MPSIFHDREGEKNGGGGSFGQRNIWSNDKKSIWFKRAELGERILTCIVR
jgi:hypothetical protein